MISISLDKNAICAAGHAADNAGCAAVSAILYALAGGLENLGYSVQWRIESGCAEIPIPDSPDAQIMRLMAEIGLRQAAEVRDDIHISDDTRERPLKTDTHFTKDTRERPQEDSA